MVKDTLKKTWAPFCVVKCPECLGALWLLAVRPVVEPSTFSSAHDRFYLHKHSSVSEAFENTEKTRKKVSEKSGRDVKMLLDAVNSYQSSYHMTCVLVSWQLLVVLNSETIKNVLCSDSAPSGHRLAAVPAERGHLVSRSSRGAVIRTDQTNGHTNQSLQADHTPHEVSGRSLTGFCFELCAVSSCLTEHAPWCSGSLQKNSRLFSLKF